MIAEASAPPPPPVAAANDRPGRGTGPAGSVVPYRAAGRRRLPRLREAPADQPVLPRRRGGHEPNHGSGHSGGAAQQRPESYRPARATLRPAAPRWACAVVLLVFAPGVTFLAALQVIATARTSLELTVIAVLIVVFINVLLVWLPIVAHLVAPEPTERRLKAFNAWLRAHGSSVLAVVLVVAGGIMAFDGIYGLVTA